MKKITRRLIFFVLAASIHGCAEISEKESDLPVVQDSLKQLKNYDNLAKVEIMVIGLFHFDKTILAKDQQKSLSGLLNILKEYRPSKIVLELEPSRTNLVNRHYQDFLNGTFDISKKYNEVYQVGFRLGKILALDSLYLFDDQTEYIGSLENFTFSNFQESAREQDDGFYNIHEKQMMKVFETNQRVYKSLDVKNRIILMNSRESQKINAQRMHMYEIRAGIQKNWIGPDWVGRFYRRNVRMASNVLRISQLEDRVLIIVGSNHKWILDDLFEYIPDFKVDSSWDFFNSK